MNNQKENTKVIIEYGMGNLKSILDDILLIYIGEEEYGK